MIPVLRESRASGSGHRSARAAQRLPCRCVLPPFCALPPWCCLKNVGLNVSVKPQFMPNVSECENAVSLTCLSPDGLVSFFAERFPSTLKFALPWDDFKTERRRRKKERKKHESPSEKTWLRVQC